MSHTHDNKDVLDTISLSTLDDISKVSEIENILNDHLENHPAGGEGSTGGGPSNPSDYLHKVNDKAALDDMTQGDLKDNVYVTPTVIANYLNNLIRIGNINVLEVNGKTGVVTLTRDDLELNNVINVRQAADADFKLHIANYDDAHISAQEKLNIYNRIAEAGQVHLGALQRSAKATVEEALLGEDDELYLTSRGLNALLTQEIGKVGTVREHSVATVNGRSGDIVLSREDINLENVLNIKQATKDEFDTHLSEMENYHVSKEWRNSVISRITVLEKMVVESLSKDMKATTDLGLAGEDDTTYVTPKVINEMINHIMTQEEVK